MSIHVSDVLVYPVKSCAAAALSATAIGPDGLLWDRCWRVVGADGRTLTQPQCPRLALVHVNFRGSCLELSFNQRGDCLLVPMTKPNAEQPVISLSKTRAAVDVGEGAAHWLSTILGVACRLQRVIGLEVPALSDQERAAELVATGYPLLMISQASLDDLNSRLENGVLMNRFRPNLVVVGNKPYEEETWKRIRIGDVTFVASDKCGRCATILVDQETGERSGKEPLRELSKYRRVKNEVIFGQYFVPENVGAITVGDKVIVE